MNSHQTQPPSQDGEACNSAVQLPLGGPPGCLAKQAPDPPELAFHLGVRGSHDVGKRACDHQTLGIV